MKIGELSKHTGVPTPLLRYYEKRGLLVPGRSENGFRCYDPAAVGVVMTIRRLLDAGLTTIEIGQLLPYLNAGPRAGIQISPAVRRMLHEEFRRLEFQISFLSRARKVIGRHLGMSDGAEVNTRTGADRTPAPTRVATGARSTTPTDQPALDVPRPIGRTLPALPGKRSAVSAGSRAWMDAGRG